MTTLRLVKPEPPRAQRTRCRGQHPHCPTCKAMVEQIRRRLYPASPFSNVSNERWGEATELALERLAKKGIYDREPSEAEVDSALEDLQDGFEPEGLK
jgi:hypothetical protein